MCLITLYFLHSTSELPFYIDVVLTLSIKSILSVIFHVEHGAVCILSFYLLMIVRIRVLDLIFIINSEA